jgi:hypothetical protein
MLPLIRISNAEMQASLRDLNKLTVRGTRATNPVIQAWKVLNDAKERKRPVSAALS